MSGEQSKELQVLSMQSWVCHGYVGNKCAVFALQVLGIEVDPINTVQFSNHTGYPSWKGPILQADQLYEIFEGINTNNLANYTHLLTGYNKDPASLRNVIKIYKKIKEKNPNAVYMCDPVMGDNGKLYIPKDLVNIYKDEVVPLADFLFPNQTECEYLTDKKINSIDDAFNAIHILHDKGVRTVIITSMSCGTDNEILIVGSTTINGNHQRFKIAVPRIDRNFTGTGDLFAALVLAWTCRSVDVPRSVELAVNSLCAVLNRTHQSGSSELKLIQSKSDLENPSIVYKVELL